MVKWGCRCRKCKMKCKEEERDVMGIKWGCQQNWVERILNPNQFLAPSEKGGIKEPCCCRQEFFDFG